MYRALVGVTLVLAAYTSPTVAVEAVVTNTALTTQEQSMTVEQDTIAIQTTLLMETFDGPDSSTVGNGWVELEVANGTVARNGNRLVFSTKDTSDRPMVSRTFSRVSSGEVVWEFEFDWARTGSEGTYHLFMQLGDGALMSANDWDAGVAVNLMWSRIDSHERLGYRAGGDVMGLEQISGPTTLRVLVNASQATYQVLIDGAPVGTALPFDQATAFDTVRFYTDNLNTEKFSGMAFDTVAITTGGAGPGNVIPTAQSQNVTLDQDTTANVTLGYTDADGPGPYTFTVVQGPANGTLGSDDGDALVTYTPAAGYSGPDSFTFRVNDGLDDSATTTINLTVEPVVVNTAPTAQDQSVTFDQATTANVMLGYTDADGPGPYTFIIVQTPANGTLGSDDGDASVTYTSTPGYSGPDSFTFRVNDGLDDSDTATVSLTVEAVATNSAPLVQDQSVTLNQDTTANVTLGYTDADGPGPYAVTIVQGPANGTLSGDDGDASVIYMPTAGYSGPDSFTFRVSDGLADSNIATVTLSVGTQTTLLTETFDGPDSSTVGNGWVELEVANGTVARNGNRLVFSTKDTSDRPMVSRTFSRVSSGEVVWEFEFDWARTGNEGTYHLFMQLGDGALMSGNDWDAGVAVNLMWSRIDSHEQLGYRAGGGVTSLAQISGPTTLRVLVNASQATYEVLIDGVPVGTALPFDQATAFDTVRFFTDNLNTEKFSGVAFDTVAITTGGAGPGNAIPTAKAQSVTLDQDTMANVTLGYTDADGPGTYTFTVVQGPANGTLGSDDGDAMVTYTPAASYSGTDSFTFRVNDGIDDSDTATVSLTVEAAGANAAPTISGTPPVEASIGQQYSFTPTASDPDGDTLTFTILNRPSWANFNSDTGTLAGTPAAGDEGTYSDISVTVSDGGASASTPQFSINVQQASMGSATLSWTAPTQNTDGTTLTDLSAFKIYYGTTSGDYPNQISIDNPGITTYLVEDLSADTYYFVSTAINLNGVESEYSNVATKVVN